MTLTSLKLWAIAPEIAVATLACLVLLVDLYFRSARPCALSYPLTLTTLIVGALLSLAGLFDPPQLALNGLVIRDGVADVLKAGACLGTAGALFYARDYAQERDLWRGNILSFRFSARLA